MDDVKVLLIAEEGLAKQTYMAELDRLHAQCDAISSPSGISASMGEKLYNGILIDVPTLIRSKCAGKNQMLKTIERFPVLRLLYNPEFDGIRGLAHGGTVKDNKSLADFIRQDCAGFNARSIRSMKRSEKVLNVLLKRDMGSPDMEAERTVTVNISESGCFVFSTTSIGGYKDAWMVINDLEDATPIPISVRWQRDWGISKQMPGFGAEFNSLTERQRNQLCEML